MKIPEQKTYREGDESELVVTVDRGSYEDINRFIDAIKDNEELSGMEKVKNNCTFITQMIPHLDEARFRDQPFAKELSYLIEVVENHGLPEHDHLDDHAVRLLAKYNNGYGVLLDDPLVRECFEEVKAHRSGEEYSERYEACLIHLHGAAAEYDQRKKGSAVETTDKQLVEA